MESNGNITDDFVEWEDKDISIQPVEPKPTAPSSVSGGFDYDRVYDSVYYAISDVLEAQQTVSDGQMVNSTAMEYFKGILGNLTLPVDYVIYVGEPYIYNYNGYDRTAYTYCMAYGDLDLNGTYFTGNGTVVRMRTSGETSVEYLNEQSISLDAPMYYSRSNLGDYSGVVQYDYVQLGIILLLIMGGLLWLMRKIFGFRF